MEEGVASSAGCVFQPFHSVLGVALRTEAREQEADRPQVFYLSLGFQLFWIPDGRCILPCPQTNWHLYIAQGLNFCFRYCLHGNK